MNDHLVKSGLLDELIHIRDRDSRHIDEFEQGSYRLLVNGEDVTAEHIATRRAQIAELGELIAKAKAELGLI